MFPTPSVGNSSFGGPPRMVPPRQMTPPRPQYLPGRYITNESEITPGEIPMDGSISFFCTNDLSRIIIKQWNSNGILDTAQYVMDVPKPIEQQVSQQQAPPQNQQVQPQQQPSQPTEQNQIQELRDGMVALTQSIENAFNNLGTNLQQALKSINDKLEDGRG